MASYAGKHSRDFLNKVDSYMESCLPHFENKINEEIVSRLTIASKLPPNFLNKHINRIKSLFVRTQKCVKHLDDIRGIIKRISNEIQ
jgi:hypothetical protein